MTTPASYPIGTPGQPWGPAELAEWRARQVRHRSYADDVLAVVGRLAPRFEVIPYGEVAYAGEHFPLLAVRPGAWQAGRPGVLVTGGVHGYETSGVHGALRFLDQHAEAFAGRVNLLVVPCVSPWAWERIHRWNFDAIDPNRSFRTPSPAAGIGGADAAGGALARAVCGAHRPARNHRHRRDRIPPRAGRARRQALRARQHPGRLLPGGRHREPAARVPAAIIDAVARITHIAPADAKGEIIGCPEVAPGVIRYPLKAWGLCASVTGARYTTTTEVYPDSPRATPEQCIAAQVAAVCAAMDFVIANG